jgi:DNA-binding transcriptional MerR regulator/effector-binding domain-containing protein
MGVLLSIGDFSRMTHLSVKALRHYHDQGLLEPANVDRSSGYRSYDPSQLPVAQVIRRLRDLGMPLDQVRAVLDAPDVESRNAEIVAHLQRMERQLHETQMSVASLRALLETPPLPLPVEFRSIPATPTIAVHSEVLMEEIVPWWLGAFEELYGTLRAAGVSPGGPGGSLYRSDFFTLAQGEVIAFVPLAEAVAVSGRVEALVIPAVEAAVMVHEGPLDDLDRTYGTLGTVVAERAIGVDGPIREYYVLGFPDTDDQSRHRTEVCWPVFQTAVSPS